MTTLANIGDARLLRAVEKLKGHTKMIQDADNNMKVVCDKVAGIATAMRKMREPVRRALPHPHLTLVK